MSAMAGAKGDLIAIPSSFSKIFLEIEKYCSNSSMVASPVKKFTKLLFVHAMNPRR